MPNKNKNLLLGGVVLQEEVMQKLLHEMRNGIFSSCKQLPAEVALAEQFNVSRSVIRDALGEMERTGYIERVRGLGTLINHTVLKMENRIDQKLEYYDLIRSLGGYPNADRIQIYPLRADANLAESLYLNEGDEIICIKKRVLSDNTPVIYSINYLPRSIFGNAGYAHIDLTPPVFHILENECKQQISSNVANLTPCYGEIAIRSVLQLADKEVLLLLDEVCFNRTCQPIMRSFSYYTNYFNFSILRKLI